jgi:putative FmdB family regulatory protein
MPIYEYRCGNCGNDLEIMQKISDAPLTECPKCHENKLEKQLSLSGFQFKGSGWYVSDYTNRGKEAGTAASESKTNGENKSENKSETNATTTNTAENSSASNNSSSNSETAKTSTSSESTVNTNTASKPETKNSKTD